jgi:hypothetical protein
MNPVRRRRRRYGHEALADRLTRAGQQTARRCRSHRRSRRRPSPRISSGLDDNQRSHGSRRTTASPRRATRRRGSMLTPSQRRYRSGRRRSSDRGARGACSGALAGSSSKRSTGTVRYRSNSQPQGSTQLLPIAAGATHRSARRLLRSQTDSDLRPVTGTARADFRTAGVAGEWTGADAAVSVRSLVHDAVAVSGQGLRAAAFLGDR